MNYRKAERVVGIVIKEFRAERERQDLSLRRFGQLSGMSRTYISMVEKGQRSPSLLNCIRLASALGLSLDDLLAKATRDGSA